jgi:hypothetical protein
MTRTTLMAAFAGLVLQGSLSPALSGSPESFHRPSGLPSGHQSIKKEMFGARASGIRDSSLKSTIVISRDSQSPCTDSITLFIDRNNVGRLLNADKAEIKVPPGEHFIILNKDEKYYIGKVECPPYSLVAVSYSFPFPVQKFVFLSVDVIPGNEQATYLEYKQYAVPDGRAQEPAPVFYGNGNILMSQHLYKSLTSFFYDGQRFVDMADERNRAMNNMGINHFPSEPFFPPSAPPPVPKSYR